jgi:hypothetical protein
MRSLVTKGLTAELQRVVANWTEWDVPRLAKRRKELIERAKAAQSGDQPKSGGEREKYYKRYPPGKRDAPPPSFTPPGKA